MENDFINRKRNILKHLSELVDKDEAENFNKFSVSTFISYSLAEEQEWKFNELIKGNDKNISWSKHELINHINVLGQKLENLIDPQEAEEFSELAKQYHKTVVLYLEEQCN